MSVSALDLFKIGIGPSSSHTVGPMRAAYLFVNALKTSGDLSDITRVCAELYGSLGATGKGHGADKGIILGLLGEAPDSINPDTIESKIEHVLRGGVLSLLAEKSIEFLAKRDILFYRKALPEHPNGLKLIAFDAGRKIVKANIFFSVGGGFVVTAGVGNSSTDAAAQLPPHHFGSGRELLDMCRSSGRSIAALMFENELVWRSESEVRAGLLGIWDVMQACVERGCRSEGELFGPLGVKRRAKLLRDKLAAKEASGVQDSYAPMDWLNLFALAVNEENDSGGRVVTAPTNGAAGIIPAVMHYYWRFIPGASQQGIVDFLLTAAAIGSLYKMNASISGAEVGCQGEVGVACSMASAGLCAVLGGTPEQVENAAEIGMEHNLGLTCDPVGGMVQIPCIERNAMGAVKAVNAARMALHGDGTHHVSLDSVIRTMMQTGADMKTKYKETSRGGLAVNIIEC
ncbi:L-serine ammonia-lyase [Paraburkholderia agricolaris]|uniref:L-serine ammonia-lyase n=1 Tax=Paraburkholderia agricolaris TaxID=2152888 RepID=UPI0038B99F07